MTSGITRDEKQLFLLYPALVRLCAELCSHQSLALSRTSEKKTLGGCRALAVPNLLLQALVVCPF